MRPVAGIVFKIQAALLAVGISFPLLASERGLVDSTSSSFAQIRTVGLAEAHWTCGFWADRFELCRTQMVPSMGRLMTGTNYSQFFRNFEIVAGTANGKSR